VFHGYHNKWEYEELPNDEDEDEQEEQTEEEEHQEEG
jgi:hypothetical protein